MNKTFLSLLFLCLLYSPMLEAKKIKKLQIGDRFPKMEGELLSSKKITLPNHCEGKVTLLIAAFKRGTQDQIDSWTRPILFEFSQEEEFRFIEIPMISNFYSWISNYINNGMRNGIISSMHKNVMTYYGSLDEYFNYFGVEDRKLCYLFLLNKKGEICYMNKGESSSNEIKTLIHDIRILLEE
ncbi:hypothetical protein [Ancylomarina longa]|uniref:Uncharacterized protein n=1 Tax=Ancylomarina longa TaxID=2487017 RepID=A0A434AV34_9BACT|nr:hypothetical protein [Ancylomarina longa]RUT78219.1 hypothetical protein DLK05_09070 [Ancylomarina longa]